MGFAHIRKTLSTFRRTLMLCNSNNNNLVPQNHKDLSQRFIVGSSSSRRFLFLVNPRRTFSSNTTDHHRINKPPLPPKETLVSNLLNRRRWTSQEGGGFMKKTLARATSSYSSTRFAEKVREYLGSVISRFILLAAFLYIVSGFPKVGKERVPYTDRDHWVVLDHGWLKKLFHDWDEKNEKRDKSILSVNSKESIRVQAVMEKLIQALNDSLRLEHDSTLHFYGGNEEDEQLVIRIGGIHNKKPSEKTLTTTTSKLKYGTNHLEKKKWEVLVTDSYSASAHFLICGLLKIHSALLDKLQDDTELATILAREIGSELVQHDMEISRLFATITTLCLLPKRMGFLKQLLAVLIVSNFFSRRREMEADYIGLMLMAAAGYDPRVAPEVYPKIYCSPIRDYIFGEPSAPKRREMLKDPEVMGKALTIYREVKERREAVSRITFTNNLT